MKSSILMAAALLAGTACADRSSSADTTAAAAATPAPDSGAAAGATTAVAGDSQQQAGLLDPNTATREQLAALPGVDTGTVSIILAGRPFADMLSVDRAIAKNRTAEQRKELYGRMWKRIDLNKAKAEEILLIPGVGNRMKREFEEYRPYTSMEQFRREIGKYVDKTELARLEQYVSVTP